MYVTRSQLEHAFTQWDVDYRENPKRFASIVDVLLHWPGVIDYGQQATACLESYLAEAGVDTHG